MGLFDNHTHSRYSVDSCQEVKDMVLAAYNKGLDGICLTDHYDFDIPDGVQSYRFDPLEQQKGIQETLMELPVEITSKFSLLSGVEVGMQPHCVKEMQELVSSYDFDTVVGSLHFIDGTDPFRGTYYAPYEYKEGYGHYLETIWECIDKFDDIDILGHYDYIARYSPYSVASIYYSEFGDVLDMILKKLAQNGKTFEINTKSYMQFAPGHQPEFDTAILKRFREFGGEFVSFGSDAHETERIGQNFEKFVPIVKSCGIKYGVKFEKRVAKPYLI